jgi:enterochelin esterase family protein
MGNILDNLISDGLIKPLIAVFVPPIDRSDEYVNSKKENFTDFIINDVIKWVDIEYQTLKDPKYRMVMGSSLGGNISLWIAKQYPNVFGVVGAFSPFIEDEILNHFSELNSTDLNIFILHGKYDHLVAIHKTVDSIRAILDDKSINYIYKEYPDSHSYGFWRAHIDELLITFFGDMN